MPAIKGEKGITTKPFFCGLRGRTIAQMKALFRLRQFSMCCRRLDVDKSGVIDASELRRGLRAVGCENPTDFLGWFSEGIQVGTIRSGGQKDVVFPRFCDDFPWKSVSTLLSLHFFRHGWGITSSFCWSKPIDSFVGCSVVQPFWCHISPMILRHAYFIKRGRGPEFGLEVEVHSGSRFIPEINMEPEDDGTGKMIFLFQGVFLSFHVKLPGFIWVYAPEKLTWTSKDDRTSKRNLRLPRWDFFMRPGIGFREPK